MAENKCLKKINFLSNFIPVKGQIIISVLFLVLASFLIATKSEAANLYLSPSSGSYTVGQTFSVTVYVGSADQAMNAASGVVSFPTANLEVTSVSKASTVISLWVQEPTFSNTSGTVNFEGIVLNPGYTGASGRMVTITFRAKAAGSATVRLSSGSVLANDGEGTNILKSLGSATYKIAAKTETPTTSTPTADDSEPTTDSEAPDAPIINSPTHPDQTKWYNNNLLKFSWRLPSGVTDISYELDNNSDTNPKFSTDKPVTEISYTDLNLEDGVWYFHLNFKNDKGWGELAHYKVSIDKTPPSPLNLSFQIESSTDSEPRLFFTTSDETSGIDKYEIKISAGNWSETYTTKNSTYDLPPQKPGRYQIEVRAFDLAGNFVTASSEIEILSIMPPKIEEYFDTLRDDQYFRIEGLAPANTTVRIYIRDKKGESIAVEEVKADVQGVWSFVYTSFLEAGEYEIWTEAENEEGIVSLPSETVKVKVTSPVILKIGHIMINYLSIILTLVAIIVLLVMIISFCWRRIKRWQMRVHNFRRNNSEEFEILDEFKLLYSEFNSQVKDLENKKILTKKEKDLLANLKNTAKNFSALIKKVEKSKKKLEDNCDCSIKYPKSNK